MVADVRKLRGSRAMPQFGERRLGAALGRAGIGYVAVPELAGRRGKSVDPSPRPCWRNRGFRNYADHMRTSEFHTGVRKLRWRSPPRSWRTGSAGATPSFSSTFATTGSISSRGCLTMR
ncbi:MAG: DUF488 domain-containing protein [Deltaproteobacteria bacterium]|nr:MAG: DUF488 domain-containing protein [Deltaproteobacteria bacterium]